MALKLTIEEIKNILDNRPTPEVLGVITKFGMIWENNDLSKDVFPKDSNIKVTKQCYNKKYDRSNWHRLIEWNHYNNWEDKSLVNDFIKLINPYFSNTITKINNIGVSSFTQTQVMSNERPLETLVYRIFTITHKTNDKKEKKCRP